MSDIREALPVWGNWAVENKHYFNYSEGSDRSEAIGIYPPKFPMTMDCSMFLTWLYFVAGGLCDPTNPAGFATHTGYTGTELGEGTEIPLSEVKPGDAIVYGPGTGWHTAMIMEAGPDPLTVSMGQQGDPSFVRVSQDGRQPQRYLRFNTAGTPRFPERTGVVRTSPKPVHKAVKAVASPFVALAALLKAFFGPKA
jgi:hypothetical protein